MTRRLASFAALAALVVFAVLAAATGAAAQAPPLTLPQPSQEASALQRVGLTDISVTYHRPAGRGRTVWGDLVPYDQVWRAGANENTVVTFSTPVTVGGKMLPAGSYGLHMIPTKADWTVILSNDSTAWGSFFYDQAKDAVRFTTRPEADGFHEHLLYTFESPAPGAVTLTLHWDKLALPVPITVDTPAVVSDSLDRQLRGLPGFFWQPFAQAAAWSANNKANLDRASAWADKALTMNRNYQTLRAKALVLERKGDATAAASFREEAMKVATEADINAYGYELLFGGKVDEAIEVFRKNVADHPASWNTYDSLGEALAVKGQNAEAATQYQKALDMVGDDTNKTRIRGILAKLKGASSASK